MPGENEAPGPNQMSVANVIQRIDLILNRKSEQLIEVAEQVAECQRNLMGVVGFYEKHLQRLSTQLVESLTYIESLEKVIDNVEQQLGQPIERPKRPEFITKKDALPGKPAEITKDQPK